MAKTSFVCDKCGAQTPKWQGQCPKCKEWNTLQEDASVAKNASRAVGIKTSATASVPDQPAARARDIAIDRHRHAPTGIGEFDRVLGGGLIPGGVILLAGEPGAGKSTLVTSIASKTAHGGLKTLIVSSEESREQIAIRANRIGADSDDMYISSETDVAKAMGQIDIVNPDLIILDSLQTMASADLDARAGSVSQVTEVATIMTRIAKERNIPMILIGQVTKEGTIAGPRVVEHLVDVVLYFEGDRDSSLRLLRGVKNRYGPADEIGCFEHSESGILEVPDPSGLLLGRRDVAVAGVATAVIIEGRRPLPIEVQALVAGSALPVPRRAVSGLDSPRTTMVQAVLERHGRVRLADKDVFASTIGGIRTREPSIDLATGIALASAANDYALPLDTVVVGEVTLSGEIRQVPGIARRLMEAERLGFHQAIIPAGYSGKTSMRTHSASNIAEALRIAENLT